jgi:uncharacterized membrane protein
VPDARSIRGVPRQHADETDWDAIRAQAAYRVFIWVYRLWLALVVGFVVARLLTPIVPALWVVAAGAVGAVALVALLVVSLRGAGVPVLYGLTDPSLASIIIFDDLFGEATPGSGRPRGTPR